MGGTRAPAPRPPPVWRGGAWEGPVDPPGRASPGRDRGAATDRPRGVPVDEPQAARQRHHHPAHPRLHPEEPGEQRCARPRTGHPQPHRCPLESPSRHDRPLDPAAPAEHVDDPVGRSPGGRTAPQPRPAARRHRRGDAALPQPRAVAQCYPPLPAAVRDLGSPHPRESPGGHLITPTPRPGFHIDVKYLPPLDRRRSYAYVAIDRATRFVYLEILPDRRAVTAAGFLTRFLDRFPLKVHTILTDNGSEFTDRFAVDKKGKPHDKPSGQHAFDRTCAGH